MARRKGPRSAIKRGLFTAEERERKIDQLGDPLAVLERHIDFAAIAKEVDALAAHCSRNAPVRACEGILVAVEAATAGYSRLPIVIARESA